MQLNIPALMRREHADFNRELLKAMKRKNSVGHWASQVDEVFWPHFEKEDRLTLPVIGVAKKVAEGKKSRDFPEALKLCEKFKAEYKTMLREHVKILKALDQLEKAAKHGKKWNLVELVEKLKIHTEIEEDLTYPAVLMIGRLLSK